MLSHKVSNFIKCAVPVHGSSRFGSQQTKYKHSLPDLPYKYNALEPIISSEIMELHHSKHHATYVNNLNAVETQIAEANATGDISKSISLQPALKFNGGGHINHSIFWKNISPNGGGTPDVRGELMEFIKKDFETFDKMIEQLKAKTIAIQGSGWGWLGYNPKTDHLAIATCANQDPLSATTGLIPLFGIDVWEHAYYLQYKNVRPDYVKAIFNVANWDDAEARFTKARQAAG